MCLGLVLKKVYICTCTCTQGTYNVLCMSLGNGDAAKSVYSGYLGIQHDCPIIEVSLYCRGSFIHIYTLCYGGVWTPDFKSVHISRFICLLKGRS